MNKQQGNTATGVIVLFSVIALCGTLGYLAYQNFNQPDTKKDNATTTIDGTAASKVVTDFYAQYFDGATKPDPDDSTLSASKGAVVKYGTTKFLTYYTNNQVDADPVLCGQNMPNTAPTVTSHKVSGDTATLTVREIRDDNTPIDITATVVEQGGLKVNTVTCPAAE